MSPDNQRIAIAEACGWAWFSVSFNSEQKILARSQQEANTVTLGHWVWSLTPDYLNDLNACHEMEKTLASDKEAADFDRELSTVVLNEWDDGLINSMEWHATAAQRAEAFLRTIGKWTTSPVPSTSP